MKILHIETGRHFYGGSQQVIYLATALPERGHDCTLVCPPDSGIDNAVRLAGIPVRNLSCAGLLVLPFAYRLRDCLQFAHETIKRARRALDLNPNDARAWIPGAGSLHSARLSVQSTNWKMRFASEIETSSTTKPIVTLIRSATTLDSSVCWKAFSRFLPYGRVTTKQSLESDISSPKCESKTEDAQKNQWTQ